MKQVIHFLTLCLLLLVTASCRTTKQLPVESRASTETTYRTIVQRDTLRDSVIIKETLFRHDSTIIQQKGDTFYVDRYHVINSGTFNNTKTQRGGIRVDTAFVNRTDTIHVPVQVEKELSKWQRNMMHLGEIAFGLIVLVLLAALVIFIRYEIKKHARSNI